MDSELFRILKEILTYSKDYPGICIERLRKTTKSLSQGSAGEIRTGCLALSCSVEFTGVRPDDDRGGVVSHNGAAY